jgi:hypothetical protein
MFCPSRWYKAADGSFRLFQRVCRQVAVAKLVQSLTYPRIVLSSLPFLQIGFFALLLLEGVTNKGILELIGVSVGKGLNLAL